MSKKRHTWKKNIQIYIYTPEKMKKNNLKWKNIKY